MVKIAAGGVASIPLLLEESNGLVGETLTPANIHLVANAIGKKAKPLPMTKYKIDLLKHVIVEALTQLS